ncbi:MAG: hypothetical protein ABIW84_01070 [Ilumatobacteraceae bacterium]
MARIHEHEVDPASPRCINASISFHVACHPLRTRLMRSGSGLARFDHAVDDEGVVDDIREHDLDKFGGGRVWRVPDRRVRWPC